MKGPEMKKERKLIKKKTGERRMARKANCDTRVAIHHCGPVPVKVGRTNASIQTARVCMCQTKLRSLLYPKRERNVQ